MLLLISSSVLKLSDVVYLECTTLKALALSYMFCPTGRRFCFNIECMTFKALDLSYRFCFNIE